MVGSIPLGGADPSHLAPGHAGADPVGGLQRIERAPGAVLAAAERLGHRRIRHVLIVAE